MKRVFIYLFIFSCCLSTSLGQVHPTDTLFTINNTPFSSKEFKTFHKQQFLSRSSDKNVSLDIALDKFILFQLKLAEAKLKKIDKHQEVKREVQIYKDIALNSFLYPTVVSEEKIEEAFERIQYYIKARHILVKINKRSRPQDTLLAYQEAQEIRQQLLKGKSFEKLARKKSDDLSVNKNKGELGYFTAFDMDYAFENAIYDLKMDDFSHPIRTEFGYHIVQIVEKTPNLGKRRLRHILLESNLKESIITTDSLQVLLKQGEKFEDLASNYSLDSRSALYGGLLPWIGQFETHPTIENAAFQLKEINEISNPIKTEFGYHFLQLVDKKDYSSITENREEIIQLIASDSRSKRTHAELISFIKKEYHFKEKKELLSNFYSILDYAYAELWEPLFSINGTDYSQEDFAKYLSLQPSKDIYETFREYVNRMYDNFSNNSILAFYKNQLLEQNLELKKVIKYYTNEILVNHYSKMKLNSSLIKQADILKFYQDNKNEYNSDFKTEHKKVRANYIRHLQSNWEKQLLANNKIEIFQDSLSKNIENRNE